MKPMSWILRIGGRRHPGRAETPAADVHLGADRGRGAWASRFDHPSVRGGLCASEQRVRSWRADRAPAQLRGRGSLASTLLVGSAGGHALSRAPRRRPRRPGGHPHPLARLGTRPGNRGARRGRGSTGRGAQRLRHERLPGAVPAARARPPPLLLPPLRPRLRPRPCRQAPASASSSAPWRATPWPRPSWSAPTSARKSMPGPRRPVPL
jgi:hypothetical protein